jgi:hypothetical protein
MHDPVSLAHAVRLSEGLFLRFLPGFDDQNRIAQAPGLPNHLSWTLGHCSITMLRCADLITGFTSPQPLPTTDWVHGDGTAGDPSRYDTESVCYGSTPKPDAKKYPRLERSVEIFRASIDKLARATAEASPTMLEREVTWGGGPIVAGDLVPRMVFHNGMHAGQIADLRRALGLGSAIS